MAVKQTYPNAKQFKKELDQKKIEHIYLFLGEEEGEKDKYIHRILDLIFDDQESRGTGTGRFHLENDELFQAVDFALSPTMFADARVCVMRNIQESPSNKKNAGLMADLLDSLPDSTHLIMTSTENRPPSAIPQKHLTRMKIVQFWRYFDEDIFGYIQATLKKRGLSAEDRAIDRLLELTGKDIRKIDEAIDMIAMAGTTSINSNSVIDFVQDVSAVTMFDFTDSLFRKEKKALKILSKLIDEGTPGLLLLAMIMKQAESIELYHSLIKDGLSNDEAIQKCGVPPRGRDKFWHFVRTFSSERIGRVFPLIARADYRLKSHSLSDSLIADPVFELATAILFDV